MLPNAPIQRTVADLCDRPSDSHTEDLALTLLAQPACIKNIAIDEVLALSREDWRFPFSKSAFTAKRLNLISRRISNHTDTSLGNRSTHTKGNNDGYPCPSPPRGHHTGNDAGIVENGGSQAVISVLTWVECRGRID